MTDLIPGKDLLARQGKFVANSGMRSLVNFLVHVVRDKQVNALVALLKATQNRQHGRKGSAVKPVVRVDNLVVGALRLAQARKDGDTVAAVLLMHRADNAGVTWEQVSADGDWDICKYNDEIYFIPEDHYTQYTNHGMFYRGDWAKEAGLENGKITKFEDLTTYFQYIKDNKEDVIPWDIAGKNQTGGILGGYITSKKEYTAFNCASVGIYTDFWGVMQDDPTTVMSPYVEDDSLYDAAELMKEWNDMGVWRKDVLNFDGDTREEFYAGTTGADQHHAQTYYSTIVPNMEKKQPGSDPQFYYWGEENQNVQHPLKEHGACAISANSTHPERALMVYDLLRNDEECYRLLNYGIEGEDYIVTEDGKLGRPDGFDSSTDALDSNFWMGRNDDLELQDESWWDGTDDLISSLDKIGYDYPFENLIVDTTAIEAKQAALANVLAKYIPQLAYGQVDDPKATVDQMREELKAAGYDDVKAAIQKDLDAFVEENGTPDFTRGE